MQIEDQQALSLAAEMVSDDSQQTFAKALPAIQALAKKVQEAAQNARELAMQSDPTAQVIMKTQMAETERKAKEAQAKMQMQQQGEQQKFQLEIAKLQQQVAELTAKYQTQSNIDAQRNATDIALANINNASKERIAEIAKGMEFDQFQMQLEHEQNINAMEAIRAAEGDIRQHGLAIEQQAFQQQAEQVKKQIDAQNQAALADQQHRHGLEQTSFQTQNQAGLADQQHQQTLEQGQQQAGLQAVQQPQTPTGE